MLIVVLWVVGLVSLAVGSLAMQSDHALRLGQMPLESLQRDAIAQAAVQQAIALLSRDLPAVDHLNEPWATGEEGGAQVLNNLEIGQGHFRVGVTREGGDFTVGLIDEERKLNLNTADGNALRRLIEAVHVSGSDPQQLMAAILDWRDAPVGPVCQGLDPPCHNGPFGSVDELRLVPGMTPALFTALEPYVTVYGSGAVNVNTAPAIVLDAIGCPGEALVQRRATPFTAPPAECPASVVKSTAFTVPVEAWLSHASVRTHLRAVIHRDGTVLAWLSQ